MVIINLIIRNIIFYYKNCLTNEKSIKIDWKIRDVYIFKPIQNLNHYYLYCGS